MRTVFKISYYLRSNYKNKEGKCPVMIRISLNGKMANIGSSGLFIEPNKWDKKSYRMKSRKAEALQFNYQLDSITTSLNETFAKLKNDETLSIDKIKNSYLGTNKNTDTFLNIFEKHNEDVAALVGISKSKATYQKYKRAEKYFRKFLMKKYKLTDIKPIELTHLMLHDFEIYMKTTGNCSHNTTAKFMQTIRTICLFAQNSNLMQHNPFANYKISFQKVDRGFLLEEELKRIIEKKITTSRLEKVRDIFLFSCFTGLAYIDVANLTKDNLVEKDGRYWIMTHRKKTKVASNILLLDIPLQIIRKYQNIAKDDKLLPILSNQKMNSYLKEIADLCGIHKNLTFHLARHTFATTVTLEKGVPIETVSKMLGHTNIKTTQIYARITTDKIEKEMLELSDKLGNYTIADKL